MSSKYEVYRKRLSSPETLRTRKHEPNASLEDDRKAENQKKLYKLDRLRLPLKHAANGSASGSLVIGDVPFLLGPDLYALSDHPKIYRTRCKALRDEV